MIKSGLSFITSHLEIEGDIPVEIHPGHILRRATDQEIDAIQKRLDSASIHGMPFSPCLYRHIVKEEIHENRTQFHFDELPKEKWKYWVIAFEGSNAEIRNIELAAVLLPTDFDVGMTLFFSESAQQGKLSGWTSMPLHLVEKYSDMTEATKNARRLQAAEAAQIKNILRDIDTLPETADFIKHAHRNYFSVRAIPSKSELRVIGYFAIIESLVTHAPRLNETLDSINHQIVNKLILLRKRFSRPIPYETYFLDAGEEKLWKTLYSYRSCLAHGGKPDFKASLQILKSHDSVIKFLREIIKELILYGIKEHVFLADLKKC